MTVLKNGTEDYRTWMQLQKENVTSLSRVWNSLDELTSQTKMLHTTNRLTQPWRTSLPIDFTFGTPPKFFGIIPRFWVRHPTHYQKHPDNTIEDLVLALFKEAVKEGAITKSEINLEVKANNIRSDMLMLV